MTILARTLALLLLLVPGCDTAMKAAPKLEETRANASGDRSGLAGCLSDCSGQKLSATDAATCRNNCETAFKVAPPAGKAPLEAAADCMHKCHAGAGTPAACVQSCRQMGLDAGEAAEVLDRLGQCVDGCEGDKAVAATDRYTCVLNCSQTAKSAPTAPEPR